MRKPPHPLGLSGCVRTRLVHIPPPRGHESRFPSARLRKQRGGDERERGGACASSFRGLTAAGSGAAVTSRLRDILKGASQRGGELRVGRSIETSEEGFA